MAKIKSKTTVKPLRGHLIVEETETAGMSPGGIVLPDKHEGPVKRGTVLEIGLPRTFEGEHLMPEYEEGDVVVYAQYAGQPVDPDNSRIMLLAQENIMAMEK